MNAPYFAMYKSHPRFGAYFTQDYYAHCNVRPYFPLKNVGKTCALYMAKRGIFLQSPHVKAHSISLRHSL